MENDPYRTPGSNLEIDEKPVRSVWWKIYFAVYLLLVILSVPELLRDPQAGLVDWLYLLILVPSLVGLYGFVFTRPILDARIWLPVLAAVFLADAGYPFATGIDLSAGMSREVYLISSAIGWLLSVPNYVALYLYSRPRNPVWKQSPGVAGEAPD